MMLRRHLAGAALGLVLGLASTAMAQDGPPPPPPGDRDSLELQVRRRMTEVLRTQVGLRDDQMARLAATNRRFERQRIALFAQEREVRMSLRQEIESGDTTRSAQVSALLDRMLALQRQRLELVEAEQRELATFMTPIQRARYFGIEEQIRRRVIEMREQQMRRGGGDGPRRPGSPAPSRGVRRPPG
jgi:protein CpxP